MNGVERISMIMKVMMVIKSMMVMRKATHPQHHHHHDCHHWLPNNILGEEARWTEMYTARESSEQERAVEGVGIRLDVFNEELCNHEENGGICSRQWSIWEGLPGSSLLDSLQSGKTLGSTEQLGKGQMESSIGATYREQIAATMWVEWMRHCSLV